MMHITWKSVTGIAFCFFSAVALSLLMNEDADVRLVVPFIGLFVVVLTAILWGRLAAILGAAAASLTFCILLFPPWGSLRVRNPQERVVLFAFQLLAIGLAVSTGAIRGKNRRQP